MVNPIQRSLRPLLVVVVSLLLPSAAYAQAVITGVVKDASGGVLPGATVEAASPALIEETSASVDRFTPAMDAACPAFTPPSFAVATG